ncbi:MAG: N-acetyl-gamma-glutamyl-phosphate reductase [Tindallia sp. MSAO_Bac2]|nr:MAG: N-acetyl-gamma-glutamyl-phosphate reductase [Tindallia sp. MSAO_Bac2]
MLKAGIMGSTGYTGAELVRLLEGHPEVELTFVDSRSYDGLKFSDVYPNLRKKVDKVCRSVEVEDVPKDTDVVFCALPHRISQQKVLPLIKSGFRVVDFSADFRIHDGKIYEDWYNTEHLDHELLKMATYGLPEWHAESIVNAELVANPGCFPTSILLPLLPLVKDRLIKSDNIIIDSKTGVSGAGRNPSAVNVFSQVNENVKAYNIGGHRHTPEIEQELSIAAGEDLKVLFTPHLIPMDRGILSTIVLPAENLKRHDIEECYEKYYGHKPFIRILEDGKLPETKAVSGSNYCDIGFVIEPRSGNLVIVSAIDNLLKGSSSQAVQNMNIMFELEESTGIEATSMWP